MIELDDVVLNMPLKEARRIFERQYLSQVVERFDFHISDAARFIGMERSALHRKLNELGLKIIQE